MGSKLEDISSAIRSCLLTLKQGTNLADLNRNYASLEGTRIPYRDLGYPTLEALIQNIPGLRITPMKGTNEWWVESIPTRETAHIAKLVSGQKKSKADVRRTAIRSRNVDRRIYVPPNSKHKQNLTHPYQSRPQQYPQQYPNQDRYRMAPPKPMVNQVKRPVNDMLNNAMVRNLIMNQTMVQPVMQPLIKSQIPPLMQRPIQSLMPMTGNAPAPFTQQPQIVQPTFQQQQQKPKKSMSERLVQKPIPQPTSGNTSNNIQVTVSKNQNTRVVTQPPPPPTPPTSGDPRGELKKMVAELGLGEPVYKMIPVQGKSLSCVYGKVEIGTSKYSSYPHEAKTPEEAQIMAARKALEELRKEHSVGQVLACTEDKDKVIERLLEIVDQHSGVFIHKIPTLYQKQYKENLPPDWKYRIYDLKEVTLERGVNDSLILCRAQQNFEKAPEPATIIRQEPRPKIIYPVLPKNLFWGVHVTLVTSVQEIWVQLIENDYSEKYEALMKEMAEHYANTTSPPKKLEENEHYAVLDNDTWHRVRLLSFDTVTNEARVFFIDIGDEDSMEMSQLRTLESKFYSLPALAMRISLFGLEEFADCENILPVVESCILDGVFCAEDFNKEVDEFGPIASVILYDTHGPDDININDLVMKKIVQVYAPRLEGAKHISTVHVSHVDTNGDVFVQVKHEGLKVLVATLNKVLKSGFTDEKEKHVPKAIDANTIYLARCNESGDWYRARFLHVRPDVKEKTRLSMFSVDFGKTFVSNLEDVLELDSLSEILAAFPPQAIKVRLDMLESRELSPEKIQRLRELAPPSQLLILKLKIAPTDSVPVVELFKIMAPDNILGSINGTLVLESECNKCVDVDANDNVKPRKRVERANSRNEENARTLRSPKIGAVGSFFDVYVTMAANPTNFTVQPWETMVQLNEMMVKLQSYCNTCTESKPSLDSIKERSLYAVKHRDGTWYRGCILNVINEQMLTVYFVDFGDVTVMTIDKLLPLESQFFELPYQAIKARLIGIKPTSMDWSPEDCVRFQELVVRRRLMSIVSELKADRNLPRDTVLGLNLVDVSGKDDVYVAEILVKEGRAVYSD